MSLRISRADHDRLVAFAAADSAREVCGMLIGSGSAIKHLIPCDNVAENPASAFEIDPKCLIAALRDERAGGEAVLGWYHSHPNGMAAPSATDGAMAADDGRAWLIITGDRVTAWRLIAGDFAPITLDIASDCA